MPKAKVVPILPGRRSAQPEKIIPKVPEDSGPLVKYRFGPATHKGKWVVRDVSYSGRKPNLAAQEGDSGPVYGKTGQFGPGRPGRRPFVPPIEQKGSNKPIASSHLSDESKDKLNSPWFVGILLALVIATPQIVFGQEWPFRYVDPSMLLGFQGGIALMLLGFGYLVYSLLRDDYKSAPWYKTSSPSQRVEDKKSHYAVGELAAMTGVVMAMRQWPNVLQFFNKPLYHMPASVLRDGGPDWELVQFMMQTAVMSGFILLTTGFALIVIALKANWGSKKKSVVIGSLFVGLGLLFIRPAMLLFGISNPLELRHLFGGPLFSFLVMVKNPPLHKKKFSPRAA